MLKEYYYKILSLYQNENHQQNFTTMLNVVFEMDALEDQGNSRVWYGIVAKWPAWLAGAESIFSWNAGYGYRYFIVKMF